MSYNITRNGKCELLENHRYWTISSQALEGILEKVQRLRKQLEQLSSYLLKAILVRIPSSYTTKCVCKREDIVRTDMKVSECSRNTTSSYLCECNIMQVLGNGRAVTRGTRV